MNQLQKEMVRSSALQVFSCDRSMLAAVIESRIAASLQLCHSRARVKLNVRKKKGVTFLGGDCDTL